MYTVLAGRSLLILCPRRTLFTHTEMNLKNVLETLLNISICSYSVLSGRSLLLFVLNRGALYSYFVLNRDALYSFYVLNRDALYSLSAHLELNELK